jgi:hypothetical protein
MCVSKAFRVTLIEFAAHSYRENHHAHTSFSQRPFALGNNPVRNLLDWLPFSQRHQAR